MGAGKSTVMNRIREKGFLCIDEPAREILKEQRKIKGDGVPEINAGLFNQLMLSRMIFQYNSNADSRNIIIFDRGIPDIIGYSDLLNTKREIAENASKEFRYNKYVFLFKGWEDIYTNDEERKMSFDPANNFGENIMKIYKTQKYETLDVPFVSVEERAAFITDSINKIINGKFL
jgi:predicted ATPase